MAGTELSETTGQQMNTAGRIVSLNHRPGSPEAIRLTDECRRTAQRFLTGAIQELFQKNDDTLFGFAERSQGDGGNACYFDAMRELRLKKEEIVRGYIERIGQGFAGLQAAEPAGKAPADKQGPTTLSLLDDAELEESLAIQSMSEKVEHACGEELTPLRHRFGSLTLGTPLDPREDPVGPRKLSDAYRDALRLIETEIEVRLVLYKVFEKNLLNRVDELYADLNELLAKNGVMVELKLRPRPERPRGPQRDRVRNEPGADEGGGAELLPLLRDLLKQQRGGNGGGAGGGVGEEGGARLDPKEVMSALSGLQQQIKAMQADAGPLSAEAVRSALVAGAGGNLSRQDNDVIDLISMLFESILDDRAVPDSVRVLLARLQIPMLKVAMVDRSFFSKPRHPARRLLNMLAKAGIGLDDSLGAENSPRLVEIERIVTTILESLTDDLELFDRLANEFEAFLAQQNQRELTAARRQTMMLRAREAKEQIRLALHRKLDEFFVIDPVPGPVEELLRGPWTDVLVETRLLKDQAIWAARSQLIRDVIMSVTPKASREARLAVLPVIGRIIPGLRTGLGSIGVHTERIDQLVAMLEPYHMAVVHGRPLPTDGAFPTEERPGNEISAILAEMKDNLSEVTAEGLGEAVLQDAAATTREGSAAVDNAPRAEDSLANEEMFTEEIILSTENLPAFSVGSATTLEQPRDEYRELARSYDAGTWFTFMDDAGKSRRAKLAWKSNLLDEYVFMDWKMRIVGHLNIAKFAGRLYDGSIAELHDTPLFDRAMDSLMGRLRKPSDGLAAGVTGG